MCFGAETSTRQVVLGSIRTTNTLVALISCMDHGSYHGLKWLHMLLTLRCHPPVKPEDIKVSGSGTDCICPRGSQTSLWCVAAGRTTDTHVVSSGIMDHSGPSRRSSSDSETFFILVLHGCPESGGSHSQVAGLEAESVHPIPQSLLGSDSMLTSALLPSL